MQLRTLFGFREFRLKKIESAFNRHMRSLNALASMRSLNFTHRMAQAMASLSQDTGREQSNLCSPPVPGGNRLRNQTEDRESERVAAEWIRGKLRSMNINANVPVEPILGDAENSAEYTQRESDDGEETK